MFEFKGKIKQKQGDGKSILVETLIYVNANSQELAKCEVDTFSVESTFTGKTWPLSQNW